MDKRTKNLRRRKIKHMIRFRLCFKLERIKIFTDNRTLLKDFTNLKVTSTILRPRDPRITGNKKTDQGARHGSSPPYIDLNQPESTKIARAE